MPSNPWLKHVKQFKKRYPNLSYKECLTKASKTYKKSPSMKFCNPP